MARLFSFRVFPGFWGFDSEAEEVADAALRGDPELLLVAVAQNAHALEVRRTSEAELSILETPDSAGDGVKFTESSKRARRMNSYLTLASIWQPWQKFENIRRRGGGRRAALGAGLRGRRRRAERPL